MSGIGDSISLAGKYLENSAPMALIFFVTKRCNAKCSFCFYWKSLNQPDSKELTLEEIEKIAGHLGTLAYARLSGGEPFIRKDVFEIVEIFASRCHPQYIGVPTNGYYTDRVADMALRAAHLDTRIEIGVSVDALGEEHDRIRGLKNSFSNAMATFSRLKEIKKQAPNLGAGFIVTASRSNQAGLMGLFEYLKNLDPDGIACNIVRDDAKDAGEKDVDLALLHRFNALCDGYNGAKAGQKATLFDRLRQAKSLYTHDLRRAAIEQGVFQIPCVAGRKIFVLYSEGEVYPCETLDQMMGNLRDFGYDINRLLAGGRAREIQGKIVNERCHCSHECFLTANVAFSARQMTRVLARAVFHPKGAGRG
jgi:MoaA/NifB/PqqE/SkfB family radical SAM enzyme